MGSLFEKLPNKDAIQNYLYLYAGYGDTKHGAQVASLEYLLRFWEESKENLYHLLDDNFIIEKPIEYKEDPADIENAVYQEKHYGKMRAFSDNYAQFITENYDKINCYEVMKDENHTHEKVSYYTLLSLVKDNYLATNCWGRGCSMKWELPNGRILDIPHGCKPIKILAKIAQAYDIEGFEDFRITHSMIVGKGTTRGTLCLSIHPLDYMTMSDNDYDWESCMNWREGGQYRMGTVEMMNSPYVIVAYLKGEKPFRFYHDTWSNKKWRNLVIVNNELISTIKGYPFQSNELNIAVIKWIQELAAKNWDIKYPYGVDNLSVDGESFYAPCDEDDSDVTKRIKFKTNVMYNDFGNGNFISIRFNDYNTKTNIMYSGVTECMCCGRALEGIDYDLEDSCFVIGTCCMDVCECEHCGSHIGADDERYEVDGETVCEYCYENETVVDAYDENRHFLENCMRVYILPDDADPEDNDTYYNTLRTVWVLEDNLSNFAKYELKDDCVLKNAHIVINYDDLWSRSKDYTYVFDHELNDIGKRAVRNFGEWD